MVSPTTWLHARTPNLDAERRRERAIPLRTDIPEIGHLGKESCVIKISGDVLAIRCLFFQ
jgi:hypothetical protein